MDLTEKEIEEYEAQLDDTSVKALLIEQNALLRDIHALLLEARTGEREASESEPQYECTRCGSQVPESELRHHATQVHNAPNDIALDPLFESI